MAFEAKSSFFDDNSSSPIWRTNPSLLKALEKKRSSKKKLFEGILYVNLVDEYKAHYFELYENRLIGFKNSQVDGCVCFKRTKVHFQKTKIGAEGRKFYSMIFTKNENSFIFLFKDRSAFTDWSEVMKKTICVRTSFHDEYKLLKQIGEGNFSKVYLAEKVGAIEEFYAVKVFDKQTLSKNEGYEKNKRHVLNEIKILLKIEHPSIVKLYGLFENDGHVFVVLEYVKGNSLQEMVKFEHKFSEKDLLMLSRNLFQTLSYLHSKNIIHRDIKFENIMIVDKEKMRIKLIDFDLACFYDPSSEFAIKSCGTPGYIAPEVFVNQYDMKVDVYSAGVILYSLMTNENPFFSSDVKKTFELNKKGEINFDIGIFRIKNVEAISLVKALLKRNPKERPSSQEILEGSWISGNESPDWRKNTPVPNDSIEKYSKGFNLDAIKPKDFGGVNFKSLNSEDSTSYSSWSKDFHSDV